VDGDEIRPRQQLLEVDEFGGVVGDVVLGEERIAGDDIDA